jgi:hypothetical protein
MLSGIFNKFGAESNGISGTEICASSGLANSPIATAKTNFEEHRI